MNTPRLTLLLIAIALLFAAGKDASAESSILDPLSAASLEQRLGSQVPLDLQFTNSKGEKVQLAD